MNKNISKIIVVALLLVKAAMIVIPNYSLPLLLTAAAIVVAVAVILFSQQEKPLSAQLPWVIAGSVLVFLVLPYGAIEPEELVYVLGEIAGMIPWVVEDGLAVIACLALIALQVFFRKKVNAAFIIARYTALYIVLEALRTAYFSHSDMYAQLVTVVVMCALVTELSGWIRGVRKHAMLKCLLLVVFSMAVCALRGYNVAYEINNLFLMDGANWLKTTLLVFAAAVLILVDDYSRFGKQPGAMVNAHNTGWVLICWCLLAVAMNVWKVFHNTHILFVAFPVAYLACNAVLKSYETKQVKSWAGSFRACWGIALVILLMLAKSVNYDILLADALIVLLIGAGICWHFAQKGSLKQRLTDSFLGIAAIVILASMRWMSLEQLRYYPEVLLGVILGSVMWCFICSHIQKMDKQASKAYAEEFQYVLRVEMALPVAVLVIAAAKVLFVL